MNGWKIRSPIAISTIAGAPLGPGEGFTTMPNVGPGSGVALVVATGCGVVVGTGAGDGLGVGWLS